MPRFLHFLTAIHAVGAVACFVMAIGSAVSESFRAGLAVSGGSAYMVARFGEATALFLAFVGTALGVLAYLSWKMRPAAWLMTLVIYGIGVAGSLWQVSIGIQQGWLAALVNGAVFIYASTPAVRRAYLGR